MRLIYQKMPMKQTVYLETSVLSYLTGRPSRDLVNAARQQITREWWESCRSKFSLHVSQPVVFEASSGDPEAAAKRLAVIKKIPLLEVTLEASELAEFLVKETPLPEKADVDALHIAVACVHQLDFILTWNFRHIANAGIRSRLEELAVRKGLKLPVICTPEELLF